MSSPPADGSVVAGIDELRDLDADDRRFVESRARVVHLEANQSVFAPGKHPEAFLLLVEGTVRVHQFAANGREIVLYRVSGGESCIMTTACLLSGEEYLAEGVTETPVTALALGRDDFDALIARSPGFRRFVFAKYAARMTHLMGLVEHVAFERIDRRLARKLLELAGDGGIIETTHQALAVELGSVREVVSRQMKTFLDRGWITTTRGHVEIVDRAALDALSRAS